MTALLSTAVGAGLLTAAPASALTGSDAASGSYAFTAKLNIGEATACTGALVDPQWVITAASCFTIDGKPAQAGKPTVKTTVTVGRTDLSQAGGSVQEAVELVPRADRDVVMVKLARRILDPKIKPVQVAAQPAAASEALTSLGFGRAKTEWVPNQLHSGVFTVASASGSSVNLNGSETAVLCQGDAGSPAVRTNGTTPELVAINSLSWQGGCLGNDPAETRTSATDVRVDDLGGWIQQTSHWLTSAVSFADVTGDGKADILGLQPDGSIVMGASNGNGFTNFHTISSGYKGMEGRLTFADITGDGKADILGLQDDGSVVMGRGFGDGFTDYHQISSGYKGMEGRLTFADITGDGKADILGLQDDGSVVMGVGTGNGFTNFHTISSGYKGMEGRLTFADITGDGKADILGLQDDGSVVMGVGTGNGFTNFHTISKGYVGMQSRLAFADVTGDGKADILGLQTDGTIVMGRSFGDGFTDYHQISSGYIPAK
ncbi:FG-GAP-like repeat-containing protein [Streptomyces sp. NBC_00212]|uniref:FG-GAP-like repeat-containing protein n=1 Tax=Streptomyces sp. NBC_00212 TaxID=2975684 RepID=UPI003245F6C6